MPLFGIIRFYSRLFWIPTPLYIREAYFRTPFAFVDIYFHALFSIDFGVFSCSFALIRMHSHAFFAFDID